MTPPYALSEVHSCGIPPDEERLVGLVGLSDELLGTDRHLFVDGLHSLLRQRTGVLDATVGERVDDTSGTESIAELRILRIVRVLRFILSAEVVQVAVELVKPMVRREVLILVTEVVLAELSCSVTKRLEHLRDRRVLRLESKVRPWHTDLRQPCPHSILTGDEQGTACR